LSATAQWLLAADVGASATRVRVTSVAGDRVLLDTAEPSAHAMPSGCSPAAVTEVVRAALAHAGVPSRETATAVGVAGLPDVVAPEQLILELDALDLAVFVVAADALTAHVGAAGLQPGASVAAGTGVVGLATDLGERWHRVDGWGHLLGDDGGGAWIGRAGLNAALRAADGRRGGSPSLLAAAVDRFGSTDSLVRGVSTRPDRAALLASFAPDVFDAATGDDDAAASIVRSAAERLAETFAATAAALPGAASVAYTGGLFAVGDVLLDPVRAYLAEGSDVALVAALGSPLDGAVALAQLAATEPSQIPRHPQLIHSSGGQP